MPRDDRIDPHRVASGPVERDRDEQLPRAGELGRRGRMEGLRPAFGPTGCPAVAAVLDLGEGPLLGEKREHRFRALAGEPVRMAVDSFCLIDVDRPSQLAGDSLRRLGDMLRICRERHRGEQGVGDHCGGAFAVQRSSRLRRGSHMWSACRTTSDQYGQDGTEKDEPYYPSSWHASQPGRSHVDTKTTPEQSGPSLLLKARDGQKADGHSRSSTYLGGCGTRSILMRNLRRCAR
jgi:hypothetical protein